MAQGQQISTDFLIIGAGIIGLNIALSLRKRHPSASIQIIEKEPTLAAHASGRNSGVLHAGFYYSKDSLKAKFTRDGNQALTQYCLANKIPINRCGKLVVTKNREELPDLFDLYERGQLNQIDLSMLTAAQARTIEPRVKTVEHALFSPTTSSVDPKAVMQQLLNDAIKQNIHVHFATRYLSRLGNRVQTQQGVIEASFIVNAAGLYADEIAKQFGFAKDYTILPFKGLYLYANDRSEKFNTHIYPVPNLKNPFLGVHFTLTVDGHAKIGPTAIPAFWREHYHGMSGFDAKEMLQIVSKELQLFCAAGFDFRGLALAELKKYNRKVLAKHAAALAQGVLPENYRQWGKPGIRAQLLNLKTKCLEMDFIVEKDAHSLHVLNAVSPAFTCSMPFADYVVDMLG